MNALDEPYSKKRSQRATMLERWDGLILGLKMNDFSFALLLLLLITLNLGDFAFTSQALRFGYKEGNPVVGYLFSVDPAAAGLFKIGIAAGFSAIAWLLRGHRKICIATVFAVGIYLDLFVYHLMGTWFMLHR